MLNINAITVRLGGRTILDRATAAIPLGSRVGLIGRNGAGKSTLMKVMIGQLEACGGAIEMPKKTRLGYIAQEAPNGTATPPRLSLIHLRHGVNRSRRAKGLNRGRGALRLRR